MNIIFLILLHLFPLIVVSLTAIVNQKPKVVVIGAGWGGWGASKALCENNCDVILIDTQIDPTGSIIPQKTPTGKPFESGTKGFWMDYPNIYTLVSEYLSLNEKEVFTSLTNSSFYSPYGLEITAPIFSSSEYLQLPSPLGQVFASHKLFKRLPISDRASVIGLLVALLDFDRDVETFAAYDRMSAHELFIKFKLSKRLIDDFIRPTLLVGLFKPPEELSAAVVMELLYYYALAHQSSFDVKWIKSKTITENIIAPLAIKLQNECNLEVKGGCFVESLQYDSDTKSVKCIKYKTKSGSVEEINDIDGIVLAVGAKGMKSIISGSPQLAKVSPQLSKASSLGSIDCIAVRIWLDTVVQTESPANVLSKFEGLRGAGGTFFMLDQLQDQDQLWADDTNIDTANSIIDIDKKAKRGSVVAADFYNAGALLSLSDRDIIDLIMNDLLPNAIPAFKSVKVVDSYVQKYPNAVNWFSPGSYEKRPTIRVNGVRNIVCAGDWVNMEEKEHGAKGLCQERAFVSGLEAANQLVRNNVLKPRITHNKLATVLPIRSDEPQYLLGKQINKQSAMLLKLIGLTPSPWVR